MRVGRTQLLMRTGIRENARLSPVNAITVRLKMVSTRVVARWISGHVACCKHDAVCPTLGWGRHRPLATILVGCVETSAKLLRAYVRIVPAGFRKMDVRRRRLFYCAISIALAPALGPEHGLSLWSEHDSCQTCLLLVGHCCSLRRNLGCCRPF